MGGRKRTRGGGSVAHNSIALERLEDDFFADHIGGNKDDWQINKDLSQSPARWSQMMSVLNGSIANNSVYETVQDYIDVDNYIDYILVNAYAAMGDWPHNNWIAARERSATGRWRFYVWDAEGSFGFAGPPDGCLVFQSRA